MLLRQLMARAFSRACAKTGKRIAARMAMIAMTTSSSMRVNARRATPLMNGRLILKCPHFHNWHPSHSPAGGVARLRQGNDMAIFPVGLTQTFLYLRKNQDCRGHGG